MVRPCTKVENAATARLTLITDSLCGRFSGRARASASARGAVEPCPRRDSEGGLEDERRQRNCEKKALGQVDLWTEGMKRNDRFWQKRGTHCGRLLQRLEQALGQILLDVFLAVELSSRALA